VTAETAAPFGNDTARPTSDDASAVVNPSQRAERIRRGLADAWGDMGAAWGVAPAIARVHGYLLSTRAPLTEREVREALGLSHRAASLALTEAEAWGLVERVAEFFDFVRLFLRVVGIVPELDPRELERAMRLIGRVPDETALRLIRLLVAIPDDDVVPLLEAMSRLSPAGARRATKLIAGVVRTVGR